MAKPTENVPAIKEEAGALAIIDFAADAGMGFEEADASAYAIPFLRILQAISPQAKKQNPKYIQGAEEGDFINTVTEKLYKADKGVTVVQCHYAHKYNEWAPERGGFRGSHSPAEYMKLEKGIKQDSKGNNYEANLATGNSLTDTREHYVMIVNDDGTFEPALLALSGSELKKSKKWMALISSLCGNKLPTFSQMFKIMPQAESNDKGDWSGIKVEHVGIISDVNLYNAAKMFHNQVRSGEVKASPIGEDEIPF